MFQRLGPAAYGISHEGRAEVGVAGRALRWLGAAAARTKSWRWSRRGRGAAAGSAGGARRGRGRPAERSRRGGAAVYGRGGSFRPHRARRTREGLLGLRGIEQAGAPPFPAFRRPIAAGRVRGGVRDGSSASVAVGVVRHAPKGVG